MAKPERYNVTQIIEAVREARGILSLTAERLGCNRSTVCNYAKKYPTVSVAIQEERDRMVDIAEQRLYDMVNDGDAWAVGFVLRTLGKSRGYVERQELSGTDGGPVQVVRLPHKAKSVEEWALESKQLRISSDEIIISSLQIEGSSEL